MEKDFGTDKPVRVAPHPSAGNRLAIGFIDGFIRFCNFDLSETKIETLATRKLKRAVRELSFSNDGEQLFAVCENRALCVYNIEANKRIRCIQKSHDNKINAMFVLPDASTGYQQVVTGDEFGEIKSWDLRAKEPLVSCFNEQEDVINDFDIAAYALLAASSDGTLGAYDFRRQKILVRSEPMHSELLCLAVTHKYCYVGSGDGYVEVFKTKEYGNLLERIKTDHPLGIDSMQLLRHGVLLTGSNEDDQLRITHLRPNKNIGNIGLHVGGVQQLSVTCDRECLLSVGWLESTIKFWRLPKLLNKIPILQSNDISSKKMSKSNFFNDLINDEINGIMYRKYYLIKKMEFEEERITCLACGSLDSLNLCPRCALAYCCVKCYRSEQHRECSESFYHECVEQELSRRGNTQKPPKTFEEFMSEQSAGDFPLDTEIPGSSDQVMDSDDDDNVESYLEKVEKECASEYQSAEERELDRQLTVLGIGTDNESLLSSLTDQEKKSFTLFYNKLLEQETGLDQTIHQIFAILVMVISLLGSCKLLLRQASTAVRAEIVGTHKMEKGSFNNPRGIGFLNMTLINNLNISSKVVVNAIEQEWRQKDARLFAVVYINKRQFKVSENDLIVLYDNVPLDVGDKIKLEKILAVGGKNFTLFGRPLIRSPIVTVNATVVEKTTSYPQLRYMMINHSKVRTLNCKFLLDES
uniref:HIT-type domain-containing protein n=1 Tax=Elaeophora elaphi TaxID=1147741 RepID=A0A0R3S0Z5_9BILA